jgi:cysteinyl-tRNA synthetase
VKIADNKRDPLDFVLWKPSNEDEPGWESPWGYGRPGWHIECSAMSHKLFGETFDIHGGGLDLQFPHHENEIAQSCACYGEDTFAKVWMHNEMLQVEGKKMSKSLGNFFSVRELLDQGYPGEVIRFVFLSTHYSKPMDWTDKKAKEAEATLRKWAVFARGIPVSQVDKRVIEALANDLNTHGAITFLHQIFTEKDAGKLRASAQMLGLMGDINEEWLSPPEFENIKDEIMQLVEPLLNELNAAREGKNYEKSDKIRDGLVALGVKPMTDKGSGRAVWHYTLQDPARARDIDAPQEGFLGVSVYIAGWLKEGLENLREEVLK